MRWEGLHQMPVGEAFWICRFAVCALRAEPDHRSEMVSQLLWGEPQQVLEVRGGWVLVRGLLDGYAGWVPAGGLWLAFRMTTQWAVVRVRWAPLFREKHLYARVPVGSVVPGDGIWHTAWGRFRVAAGHVISWPAQPRRPNVGRVHALFQQTPYLWGGKSPAGIDCSGLVQIAYRLSGWLVPRDSAEQAAFAVPTPEPRPGDLAFYSRAGNARVCHVALCRTSNTLLHATPGAGTALTSHKLFTHTFHSYRTLLA